METGDGYQSPSRRGTENGDGYEHAAAARAACDGQATGLTVGLNPTLGLRQMCAIATIANARIRTYAAETKDRTRLPPAWHAGGRRFESDRLQEITKRAAGEESSQTED